MYTLERDPNVLREKIRQRHTHVYIPEQRTQVHLEVLHTRPVLVYTPDQLPHTHEGEKRHHVLRNEITVLLTNLIMLSSQGSFWTSLQSCLRQ